MPGLLSHLIFNFAKHHAKNTKQIKPLYFLAYGAFLGTFSLTLSLCMIIGDSDQSVSFRFVSLSVLAGLLIREIAALVSWNLWHGSEYNSM